MLSDWLTRFIWNATWKRQRDLSPHEVFVFGAGAHCEAGYPLYAQLFSRDYVASLLSTLIALGDYPALQDQLTALLDEARHFASYNEHFEELLGRLIDSAPAEAKRLLSYYTTLLRCADSTARLQFDIAAVDNIFYLQAFYWTLLRSRRPFSIFTFNHDTLPEQTMSSGDFAYGDVLHELTGDVLPQIRLYKPHGSLNWGFCEQCNLITNAGSMEGFPDYPRQCSQCGLSIDRPYVVPPDHRKRFATLHSINNFRQDLTMCRKVFFFGYSMPEYDHYVRPVFARHIPADADVFVIDPYITTDLIDRFDIGVGNISFVKATFRDFVMRECKSPTITEAFGMSLPAVHLESAREPAGRESIVRIASVSGALTAYLGEHCSFADVSHRGVRLYHDSFQSPIDNYIPMNRALHPGMRVAWKTDVVERVDRKIICDSLSASFNVAIVAKRKREVLTLLLDVNRDASYIDIVACSPVQVATRANAAIVSRLFAMGNVTRWPEGMIVRQEDKREAHFSEGARGTEPLGT